MDVKEQIKRYIRKKYYFYLIMLGSDLEFRVIDARIRSLSTRAPLQCRKVRNKAPNLKTRTGRNTCMSMLLM